MFGLILDFMCDRHWLGAVDYLVGLLFASLLFVCLAVYLLSMFVFRVCRDDYITCIICLLSF